MFKGIEGARAYLSWIVVVSHIAVLTGMVKLMPSTAIISKLADVAVRVFIIISGFVIAHLIEAKREPYRLYIARRFLRIFPAYIVCLVLAIAVAPLSYKSLIGYPLTEPNQLQHLIVERAQYSTNLARHIIAHIALLHGIISNNILPDSEYMFLAPAWSLSLEWQFYIIAPLWVALFRKSALTATAASALAFLVYEKTWSGSFVKPSFLPGASLFFLLGIGTRFSIAKIPASRIYLLLSVLSSACLILISKRLLPLFIWVIVVAYVKHDRVSTLMDGRLIRAAGARSFAVYIAHYPIIFISTFITISMLHLAGWVNVFVAGGLTVVSTALASEVLYSNIEKPCIEFSRSLSRRQTPIRVSNESDGWQK